jgi:ABC-type glutathione transport system ATPase component
LRRSVEGEAARSPDPVLEIQGLSLDFSMPGGDIHAVDDVDIRVQRGKITMLVGESGSGKSAAALAVMVGGGRQGVLSAGKISSDTC